MTFTQYGLRDFEAQYWDGSAWQTIPGATVTGNTLVWRHLSFAPVTTTRIRIVIAGTVDSWSRIVEVEAWGTAAAGGGNNPPPVNVAAAAAGATASASSSFSVAYGPDGVINGDRAGLNWGSGGAWNDATASTYPDWVQVDFNGTRTISEIDVFTVQDTFWAPVEPTATMTFTQYGVRDFEAQYWNGSAWQTIPGTTVTGNNLVWRRLSFAPVTTTRIRIVITGTVDSWSRIAEVEAWGTP